jgi:SAC3 family protein LENG8/THP3
MDSDQPALNAPPPMSFVQPPPNFGNSGNNNNSSSQYQNTYFSHVQQYAQNRLQQMGPSDFYESPSQHHFFNHQQSNQAPSLFNKPIRFNISKQGMKANPMMRNLNNPQMPRNDHSVMNNFQNVNMKKRKNKKKNKRNKNNSFNGIGDDSDGFTMPTIPGDFNKPPPPIGPHSHNSNSFMEHQKLQPDPPKNELSDVQMAEPLKDSTDGASTAMEWPESLYNYVARCYMKCTTPLDKDMCEITLKGKITMAANRGELFKKDWANEPMPVLHSARNAQQTPPKPLVNQTKSSLPGAVSQFQNATATSAKKGISSPLTARLGRSMSGKKARSRSSSRSTRSRSRTTSPLRKRINSEESNDSKQQHRSNAQSNKKKITERKIGS